MGFQHGQELRVGILRQALDAGRSLDSARAVPGVEALGHGSLEAPVQKGGDAVLAGTFLGVDDGANVAGGGFVGSAQTLSDGEVGVAGTHGGVDSDVALGECQDSGPEVIERQLAESSFDAWILGGDLIVEFFEPQSRGSIERELAAMELGLQEGGVGGHFRGTAGGEESGDEKEAQHLTVVSLLPVQSICVIGASILHWQMRDTALRHLIV